MQKLEKVDSKQKILDATSALFLEGGLPALSVRAISKKAGLSTIGIYSHFQGKQGILDELYIEGFNKVYDAVDVNETSLTPKKAVLNATKKYLDVVENYQAHYQLIFGKSETGYVPSPEAEKAGIRAFTRMTELVSTLLPTDTELSDVQRSALDIWAITHGYAGLQQHAVSQLLDIKNWRALTLGAVANHIDAMG